MKKQAYNQERGAQVNSAARAPTRAAAAAAARLEEIQEAVYAYAAYNPFAKVFLPQLTELEETIAAENLQLFWRKQDRLCKELAAYGIVVQSYINKKFRLG